MKNYIKSKFFKLKNIEFYAKKDIINLIEHPRPSIKFLPEWFKKLSPSFDALQLDNFGLPRKTAKGCPPLLDAYSLGITIPFPTDLHIRTDNDLSNITVHEPFKHIHPFVEEHHIDQLGGTAFIKNIFANGINNNIKSLSVLKFINPWIIKTPPGWSTLFIHPINNFNLPFTTLGGVVETDKYFSRINFPVLWTLPNVDMHIEAGTPLVTCVPFKRNKLNKTFTIKELDKDHEYEAFLLSTKLQSVKTSFYKKNIRGKDNEV